MEYLIKLFVSFCLLLLLAACNSSSSKTDTNPWQLVQVSGAQCGNGDSVNMATYPSQDPTGKLVIYLQSGGACWDETTCNLNGAVYTSTGISNSEVRRDADAADNYGVLNRTSNNNPFKNDDFVYIPYCTGDVHAGSKSQAGSSGVLHSGGQNLLTFIEQGILPNFPDIEVVYLVGASAGGFGAIIMYESVKDLFGAIPVHLLSDGGMPLPTSLSLTSAENLLTMTQFQTLLKTNWGHDVYLNLETDYIEESFEHIISSNTGRRFGLISSLDDQVIQRFIGTGLFSVFNYDQYTKTDWLAAITQITSQANSHANTHVFFHQSQLHVFSQQNTDNYIIGTTSLTDWLEQFRSGVNWQSYSDL